jgi:hypothetical protein
MVEDFAALFLSTLGANELLSYATGDLKGNVWYGCDVYEELGNSGVRI